MRYVRVMAKLIGGAMASVQLKLLRRSEADTAAVRPVEIRGRKIQALLAYLASHAGKKLSRDKLTGMLWSDRGEAQARSSLRQALLTLRRDLAGIEPAPLIFEGDAVGIDASVTSSDVTAFERLAASKAIDDLRQAVALYGGDFLDGIAARDQAFDDWLSVERTIARIVIGLLGGLLVHRQLATRSRQRLAWSLSSAREASAGRGSRPRPAG